MSIATRTLLLRTAISLVGIATAQTAAAATPCTLHVSGAGWPTRMPKMAIFLEAKRLERETPLSPDNIYGGAYRASTLDDALLARLLPDREVRIVHHADIVDLDATPLGRIKTPIHAGDGCTADLVLHDITGIIPNPERNPYGLAGQLLAGGSRFISSFWLLVRVAPDAKVRTFTGRFDSPMPSSVLDRSVESRAAIAAASNDNLHQFVEKTIVKWSK